jgi:hypothetical protein
MRQARRRALSATRPGGWRNTWREMAGGNGLITSSQRLAPSLDSFPGEQS